MVEEAEPEPCFSTLSFPFLPLPAPTMAMHSPDHPSGTATPPLQTLASVPFKWEEQPGKPRPCTAIIPLPPPPKRLELPPSRVLLSSLGEPAAHKMPSPTTVLDGPYNVGRPKFSSFRLFREAHDSFDSRSSNSPESAVGVLLGKRRSKPGFFRRTLRFKTGKKEVADGDSFSTTGCDCESYERSTRVKMEEGKLRRSGSFSSSSQPTTSAHLWSAICESLNQVMAWKTSRKSKKERLGLKKSCL
ncbi:hypothetical protein Salat_2689000 [Sesamum alatum]|uniref:Uncharacterized protein n=1 Tax=Sesamum alatum TaxID=300844 RepID=A0AAE1XQS7_9LAMI|nr:hypothetical protein Salat_2689000 [Sesamum alatum]